MKAAGDTGQGVGRTARESDQNADRVAQLPEGAAGQADGAQERTYKMAQTARRGVDGSGNTSETSLSGSNEVVDQGITGIADFRVEEEYIDDQGRIVGRGRDEFGNIVEEITDEEGNVLDPNASEMANERETEDAGADATEAAERKARELGVQLSEVRGTGSGGRILVRDVEKAAKS